MSKIHLRMWRIGPMTIVIVLIHCFTSCRVMKEAAEETLIESVSDQKTGTQVFVRDNDSEPYAINVGGIIKARKDAKKKKAKDILNNY